MRYKSQEVPETNKDSQGFSLQGYRSKTQLLGRRPAELSRGISGSGATCRELSNLLSYLKVLQGAPGIPNPLGNGPPKQPSQKMRQNHNKITKSMELVVTKALQACSYLNSLVPAPLTVAATKPGALLPPQMAQQR